MAGRGFGRLHPEGAVGMSNLDYRSARGETLAQRLARDSEVSPSGCVLWRGPSHRQGYGHIRWNGRLQLTHRLALEASGVAVTSNLNVLHACDTPSCVNPAHLRLGTQADNMRDASIRGRIRAPRGEAHHDARLTRVSVEALRNVARLRVFTTPQLARWWGVGRTTVQRIVARKTWKCAP